MRISILFVVLLFSFFRDEHAYDLNWESEVCDVLLKFYHLFISIVSF